MTKLELLKKANEGHSDGFLKTYFDPETGEFREGSGDTLAEFIVHELSETIDPEWEDEEQLSCAIGVLETAMDNIRDVILALEEGR